MKLPGFRATASLMLIAILCAACPPPPPKEAPQTSETEAEAEAEAAPKKKPKKTCKTLTDKCKGGGTKKTRVLGAEEWRFAPPKDWVYAKLPEATVTQASKTGAVLAIVAVKATKNVREQFSIRTDMLTALSSLIGVTLKSPKTLFFSPSEARKAGPVAIALWEQTAKRGEGSGDAIVVIGSLGEMDLMAVGYVATDDEAGGNRIFDALETLEKKAAREGAAK